MAKVQEIEARSVNNVFDSKEKADRVCAGAGKQGEFS